MARAMRARRFSERPLRAISVLRNYGVVSKKKFEDRLESLQDFLHSRDIPATFSCPSNLLGESTKLIDFLRGHDAAIHGLMHTDYKGLPSDTIREHVLESVSDFKKKGLQPNGFRAPYLRWNTDLLRALRSAGLTYDSSSSVLWDASIGRGLVRNQVSDLLSFYGSKLESNCPSLPKIVEGVVQLPVSLPDDEILVERLRISRSDGMIRFWSSMLRDSHQRRRLLVLQVHPERFDICQGALMGLLQQVKERNAWITSLSGVSSWWKRRCAVEVRIDAERRLDYDDMLGIKMEAGREVFQQGDRVPAETLVRMTPGHRLYNEALEIGLVPTRNAEGYHVDDSVRTEEDLMLVAEKENLLHKSFWPDGHRSAFCLSGDIDALTAMDFVRRPLSRGNRSRGR